MAGELKIAKHLHKISIYQPDSKSGMTRVFSVKHWTNRLAQEIWISLNNNEKMCLGLLLWGKPHSPLAQAIKTPR